MQSERQNFQEPVTSKTEIVRTEFILRNIFSYMLNNIYFFNTICAENKKEKDILDRFKASLKRFGDQYGETVRNQCLNIPTLNENNVDLILTTCGNEQFSEGITWSQIIAFVYFVGELTLLVIRKDLSNSLVERIFECFSKFVKEKLTLWIQDHNGWEGLCMKKEDVLVLSKPSKNQSLIHILVKFVGTVSHIKNILNGNIF